jgi:hypothetical protein
MRFKTIDQVKDKEKFNGQLDLGQKGELIIYGFLLCEATYKGCVVKNVSQYAPGQYRAPGNMKMPDYALFRDGKLISFVEVKTKRGWKHNHEYLNISFKDIKDYTKFADENDCDLLLMFISLDDKNIYTISLSQMRKKPASRASNGSILLYAKCDCNLLATDIPMDIFGEKYKNIDKPV